MFPYIVSMLPEILRMTELNDNPELQSYSSGVLYIISSIPPSSAYISVILNIFVDAIKKSASWRLRLHALPTLVVFFYRNLLAITSEDTSKVMDVLLLCLSDENIEVREMASKTLSSVVRCSQRHSILPLKVSTTCISTYTWVSANSPCAESVCEFGPEDNITSATGPSIRDSTTQVAFGHPWALCTYRNIPLLCGTLDAATDRW